MQKISLRTLSILLIALAGSSFAADSSQKFPLWDGSEPVAEYAKKVNLPPTKSLDLGNGVKLELVLIPAGKFIMGKPEPEKPIVGQTMVGISVGTLFAVVLLTLIRAQRNRTRLQFSMRLMLLITFVTSIGVWGGVRWNEALKNSDDLPNEYPEHPAHPVRLTQPFYMGRFTVTQEQYQRVMGFNPSQFQFKDNPVEKVSWDHSQTFCKTLAELTKQTVRLPTEAEWEYACRAGTTTAFYSGSTEADLARVAWYRKNSLSTPHPVGQKEPNAFGLYDMHGNVSQWCEDWYGEDFYAKSPMDDPRGPMDGETHIIRGSTFRSSLTNCRSTYRFSMTHGARLGSLGFRVVVPAFPTP